MFDNFFAQKNTVDTLSGVIATESDPIFVKVGDIKSIKIDWISDKVTVVPYDGKEIKFYESSNASLDEKDRLVYTTEKNGEELVISWSKNTVKLSINIGNLSKPDKQLYLFIPKDITLDKLDLDTVATTISLKDLSIKNEIDISTVSGIVKVDNINCDNFDVSAVSSIIEMNNVKLGDVDLDSISGNVRFVGEFSNLEINTTNGESSIVAKSQFSSIDINTISGDAEIEVLKTQSPSFNINSTSGKIEIFGEKYKNSESKFKGDDESKIDFTAVSASIEIVKG